MITGMLIAQNADRAAAAKEFDGFLETVFAIEHFNAGTAAQTAHVFIDKAVPQFLVNRAVSDVTDKPWQNLGKQFPVAEMAQDKHDGPAGAQLSMDYVKVFRLNSRLHLFERHNGEFDAAKKVGAQSLKMAADKAAQFAR